MKNFAFFLTVCFLSPFFATSTESLNNPDRKIEIKIDSIEISAFLDGVIKSIMEDRKIPGASLVIVNNGKTLVKKGYGYSDIKNKIEVDPDSTLFRIGSISKLFTWIAILQQIEKNNLDIDTDINEYLTEFKIPETFEEPITIRSLMSHSPGFEDVLLHLFVKSAEEMKPLADIFKNQMPKRVRPPLKYAAYSNHGTGLAQYLIELKSNMKFEEYTEKFIFEPIGLYNTTFRQPLPDHLSSRLSKGYSFSNGVIKEKYFEYIPIAGAGATSTTAGDMGRFMQALLQTTCIDTICLLEYNSFKQMKEPALIHAEGMNPALHGFMDLSRNGINIIGHGGDTFWFHSLLALMPEYNIGFFISFNSFESAGVYAKVFEQFLNRYFPDQREPKEVIKLDKDYLEIFTGKYKQNRHSHSDFLKLLSILNITTVSIQDSMLKIDGFDKRSSFWVPIDSVTFKNIESNELIAFELNEKQTSAEKMFSGYWGIFAFEKIRPIDSPDLHNAILLVIMFTLAFILFIWPYIYIIRRKHQRMLPAPQLIPFPAKFVAWISAACFFLFYLIILIISAKAGQELIMGVPAGIKIALFLPFLAMPFIVLMLLQAIILWKMRDVKWRSRLFYYFSIVVFFVAIIQLYYWNLLGWNY